MTYHLKNAFIESHFNYCPLIWMFCKKSLYNKIANIHHKSLKIVYQNDNTYEELLQYSRSKSIHQKHLCFLVTEVYKSVNNLNPIFMRDFFQDKIIPYQLRGGHLLKLPKSSSVKYGTNNALFRACIAWNRLPADIKNCTSVLQFKRKIKIHGKIACSCAICI